LLNVEGGLLNKIRGKRICTYFWSVTFFLVAFSEIVNAQLYDKEKYSKVMWNYLEVLSEFGPRYVGTKGYEKTLRLIKRVGGEFADEVLEHTFFVKQHGGGQRQMVNIEFIFNGSNVEGRPILLGAHYDTRPFADQESDPILQTRPIIGSNDGGSGTSILLGLAQYLKEYPVRQPVRLLFFDGEDFGQSGSGEMFLGSKHHANYLRKKSRGEWPKAVIIVDMVGDKDLEIFKETHSMASGPKVLDRIYHVAKRMNSFQFNDRSKYTIRDDHLPFAGLGIPSVVLIDFDYPYWHKLSDTLDKCSPESLSVVFSVLVGVLSEW
jgi:glutaminyl-peptide cyclotransferase